MRTRKCIFWAIFWTRTTRNCWREIKKFQTVRKSRIHEMAARLNKIGIALRAETVFALANCHSPGRPHVARALVQEGLCAEPWTRPSTAFLKKGRPAWVPKFKISALDAIALIHQAGGLAVMAHPGLNHCDEIIPALAGQGLDGIECFHTKHTAKMSEHYLQRGRAASTCSSPAGPIATASARANR